MARLDKPWRYSHTERRLFTTIMAGGTIDFTDEDDYQPDDKPSISGAFLSALWKGELTPPDKIVPAIALLGLRIDGSVSLLGVRQRRSPGETVPRLVARHCEFVGMLGLDDAPLAHLEFTHCRFAARSRPYALNLQGSEVRSAVQFAHCDIEGRIQMNGLKIGRSLNVIATTIHGAVTGHSLKCGSALTLRDVAIRSNTAELSIDGAEIADDIVIMDLRCEGKVSLGEAAAPGLVVKRVSAVGRNVQASLSLHAARISGPIILDKIYTRGFLDMCHVNAEGLVKLTRIVANSPSTSQSRPYGHIAMNSLETDSRLHLSDISAKQGTLGLPDAKIGDGLVLTRFKAMNLVMGEARASKIDLSRGAVDHVLRLDRIETKSDLTISKVLVGYGEDPGEDDTDSAARRSEVNGTNMTVGGALFLTDVLCRGRLTLGGSRVTGAGRLVRVGAREGTGLYSLELWDFASDSSVELRQCSFSHGANLLALKAFNLSVFDCYFRSSAKADDDHAAFRAPELDINGDVYLGRKHKGKGHPIGNRFEGMAMLVDGMVGGSIIVSQGHFSSHVDESTAPGEHAHALILNRTKVGVSIRVATGHKGQAATTSREEGLFFDGCISCDKVRVGSNIAIVDAFVEPVGRSVLPSDRDEDEDRIWKRKRGVVLSMLDAELQGSLSIGGPTLSGIVDLRDSRVGRIRDRGGFAWQRAGVERGKLLFEGLAYDDLEERDQLPAQGQLQRVRNALLGLDSSSEARAPLDWIDYQYPDGEEEFSPQPYEQLAGYFSANGNERARRQVLVAKRERQRTRGGLNIFERGLGWVLKVTSNYGYSPARALLWLFGWFALGGLIAWGLGSVGAIQPNSTDTVSPYPYNYLVLAIDAAIPIIDLDHDSMLTIRPEALPWWASANGVLIAKAVYEIVGMLLLSVAVLTLTGTLREKE